MLSFFQRHERVTLFSALLIVLLFLGSSFFVGGNSFSKGKKERVYTQSVMGTPITSDDIRTMKMLLATSSEDAKRWEGERFANFFNKGVVRKTLIRTGLAKELIAAAPTYVQENFSKVVSNHNAFCFYRHPYNPKVSAETIWNFEEPAVGPLLARLKQKDLTQQEQFQTVADLYKIQERISPKVIWEKVHFSDNREKRRDPDLNNRSMALFGADDLVQWFGDGFLEQVCLFIHNVAALEEKERQKLSLEEVKQDLMRQGSRFLSEHSTKKLDQHAVEQSWQYVLKYLGINEKKALGAWKKVMLFERKMDSLSKGVLLDGFLLHDFNQEAGRRAIINVVELKDGAKFGTLKELAEYYFYCTKVYEEGQELGFLAKRKPLSVLEKESGDLLETLFEVKMRQLNFEEVIAQMPLKEIKAAMLEDGYYQKLASEFHFLDPALASKQERFSAIQKLSWKQRQQIENHTKKQILTNSSDKIKKLIHRKRVFTKALPFSKDRLLKQLPGIHSGKAFLEFLKQVSDESGSMVKRERSIYTEDNNYYYEVLSAKLKQDKLLTEFKWAKKMRLIEHLLEQELIAFYAKQRQNGEERYKASNGKYKSFSQVETELILHRFKPFFEGLDTQAKTLGIDLASVHAAPDKWYPKLAFIPVMNALHSRVIKERKIDKRWLDQYPVIRLKRKVFGRGKGINGVSEDLFQRDEGVWSDVQVAPRVYPHFFCKKGEKVVQLNELDAIGRGKKFLKDQAQVIFVQSLAKEMEAKRLFEFKESI